MSKIKSKNIFDVKLDYEKYNVFDTDNPAEIADIFVKFASTKNYRFDYSLNSLKFEIDRFLSKYNYKKGKYGIYDKIFKRRYLKRNAVATYLSAYIGETLIKLYGGKWIGSFSKPENPFGDNYYMSELIIKNYKFNPSHFILYRLEHGEKETGTFYKYLYSGRISKYGDNKFLDKGLIDDIEKP